MSHTKFLPALAHSVLLSLLTLIIVLVLIVGGIWLAVRGDDGVDKGSWLVLDLYGDLHEYDPPAGPLGPLAGGGDLTLQDLLDNLGKAAVDDRIAGVIFRISASNSAGWAKLDELRRAVDRVQAAGKPVHAWADALDMRALYLAAGCDDVLMPEGGYLEFRGWLRQRPYIRGVLDKLGVEPHLHKIKDYKAAAEIVMDTHASDAAKENMQWIADDVWDVVMAAIAADRKLPEEKLLELMEYALFTPNEAAKAGLIDEVIYMQELEDRLKDKDDDVLRTVDHFAYADVSWKDAGLKTGDTVAVVHAQGNIGGRENRIDPLMGIMMGHESIVRELQRCRLDDKVKAVVFRVDSGGGESLASDLIAHEVERLAAVKPVVVSMVDVAASGGYMIAFKATKMMADATTVTGSIGSINGMFNLAKFYEKIGFNWDGIAIGPMAEFGTDSRAPTDKEWARNADAHWISFNGWLQDVADRRGMTFEHAETLAHGRTWTGRQAVANNLIDATGDLVDAIALAQGLAGMDAGKAPSVLHLPEKQGLFQSLFGDEPERTDPVAAAARLMLYRELRTQVRETSHFLEYGAANVVE